MRRFLFFLLLFNLSIMFSSCNKETSTAYTDTPIIEGFLISSEHAKVKIYRQTPFSDDPTYSPDDIDHLEVRIQYNGTEYILTPIGNCVYENTSVQLVDEGEYYLSFTFNSKNVSAYTKVPSKPQNFTQSAVEMEIERMDTTFSGPPSFSQPDPIELNWDNPDGSYYLIVVENMESFLDPIRDFGDVEPPANIFRKSPTQAEGDELRAMEFEYYGTHRIILYHVLPDYAALYEENSTSSQNISNPSSSIVNGYGIFTGLNADTLYVEVKEP